MLRWLLVVLTLGLWVGSPAFAGSLYGSVGIELYRDNGTLTQQPPGSVVSVDASGLGTTQTPGGTTLLRDVYDAPSPYASTDGVLLGLTYSHGSLYGSTSATNSSNPSQQLPSHLLQIDPATGTSVDRGIILDGSDPLQIVDLATDPLNGQIFGISGSFGSSCFGCLYTIDPTTAAASRIGVVPLNQGYPGGLAFGPAGTLYLTTTFPIAGIGNINNRNPEDLVVLDPATGQILSQENVLLEQQLTQTGGGQTFLITSTPLGGLAVAPDGTLIGTGDNLTTVYERVQGAVLDPNGNPTGTTGWVWRVLGDSGENLTDLAYVPEPGTATLLVLGLAVLAPVAFRRSRRNRSAGGAPVASA